MTNYLKMFSLLLKWKSEWTFRILRRGLVKREESDEGRGRRVFVRESLEWFTRNGLIRNSKLARAINTFGHFNSRVE